jgi:hypothetical protein
MKKTKESSSGKVVLDKRTKKLIKEINRIFDPIIDDLKDALEILKKSQ